MAGINSGGLFAYPDPLAHDELADADLVALDFETTGLGNGDRVVEIGAVRVRRDGTVVDEWATLVNPGCDVGPTFVHRITNDMVADAPPFDAVLGQLLERLDGAVIVAHNASFEERFFASELRHAGVALPGLPALCTLQLARTHLDAPNHRLATCCESIGVDHSDAHAALGDARVTARLIAALLRSGVNPTWSSPNSPLPRLPSDARPRLRTSNLRKGTDGWMASLLSRLPASTLDGEAPAVGGYRSALAAALEDGKLTGVEAKQLGRLAGGAGLGQAQVHQLNSQFLEGLRSVVLEDDVVTAAELRWLHKMAGLLSQPDYFVDVEVTGGPAMPTTPQQPRKGSKRPSCSLPAPPPSEVSAGWLEDPLGRAPMRWWDGTWWSEHVSDGVSTLSDTPWLPDVSPLAGVDAPGEVDGMPTHIYDPVIRRLRNDGSDFEALVLAYRCIDATENEAHLGEGGVAPAWYEHAAITHRKRGERELEVAVLQRFARQRHAPGSMPPKLLDRLEKAQLRLL